MCSRKLIWINTQSGQFNPGSYLDNFALPLESVALPDALLDTALGNARAVDECKSGQHVSVRILLVLDLHVDHGAELGEEFLEIRLIGIGEKIAHKEALLFGTEAAGFGRCRGRHHRHRETQDSVLVFNNQREFKVILIFAQAMCFWSYVVIFFSMATISNLPTCRENN